MSRAKKGDTVLINYVGRLEDGTVFDSSEERAPLEFTIGDGRVIPGFEQAVEGMEPGEEKTATLSPDEAYGPRREDLLVTVARERLPEGIDPAVGQELEMRTREGRTVPVRVARTTEEAVVIDANHPLAGQELTFDIELVRIG